MVACMVNVKLTKKAKLGLTVLMDLHFLQSFGSNFELSSPLQPVMSYKYNHTFTKMSLLVSTLCDQNDQIFLDT